MMRMQINTISLVCPKNERMNTTKTKTSGCLSACSYSMDFVFCGHTPFSDRHQIKAYMKSCDTPRIPPSSEQRDIYERSKRPGLKWFIVWFTCIKVYDMSIDTSLYIIYIYIHMYGIIPFPENLKPLKRAQERCSVDAVLNHGFLGRVQHQQSSVMPPPVIMDGDAAQLDLNRVLDQECKSWLIRDITWGYD